MSSYKKDEYFTKKFYTSQKRYILKNFKKRLSPKVLLMVTASFVMENNINFGKKEVFAIFC